MKTTIDIPEPVTGRISALAKQNGRNITDQVLQVLQVLLATDALVSDWASILRHVNSGTTQILIYRTSHHGSDAVSIEFKRSTYALPAPVRSVDPATGLSVVNSPPDAPIHHMTAAEFQSVVDEVNEEADFVHARLPVRH